MIILGTVSDAVAIGSIIVAGLSVIASIVFQLLAARRDRDKLRYGIVYEERFRAHKELYTRLSQLRDAVERYTYEELGPGDQRKFRPNLEKRADAFRRSLRQNDVILDESTVGYLDSVWAVFKDKMYEYDDAKERLVDTLPSAGRKGMLDALDQARNRLKPQIRRDYGIKQ